MLPISTSTHKTHNNRHLSHTIDEHNSQVIIGEIGTCAWKIVSTSSVRAKQMNTMILKVPEVRVGLGSAQKRPNFPHIAQNAQSTKISDFLRKSSRSKLLSISLKENAEIFLFNEFFNKKI